jgi:hypothetical protein
MNMHDVINTYIYKVKSLDYNKLKFEHWTNIE